MTATVDFEPGGTQTLRLCDAHTWEMYMAMVRWFSGDEEKGGGATPGYRKTARMD